MLNQVVLVGRLAKEPTQVNEGKAIITLAVPNSFKNANGEYDTNFIDIVLWNGIATNTMEYCKQGDIIGVKGRIQRLEGQDLQIVAEKITFLSSKKNEED